jgi:hypothetical protein
MKAHPETFPSESTAESHQLDEAAEQLLEVPRPCIKNQAQGKTA